jgi:malate dehydrogenase (oxaloacetate-decarboxylating)(NADP+)
MPIVYTPVVGEACRKFGFIFRKPKGLYITIHDFTVDQIHSILRNWPEPYVRAIVVTDGERILGLGDLGAHGMGIPIGKLSLYCALAGIQPRWTLPILVDVGTNNKELLDDPFYTGLKQERVRGEKYDEFLDNFCQAVVRRFGQNCLIQWEDFGNQNAFRILEKYRNKYCTFNDDIQGTASVALAGVIAALRITGKKMSDNKFLFYGAGEANIGIGTLICLRMMEEGLTFEEATKRVWMVDSKGLLVKSRTNLSVHKKTFAQDFKEMTNLEEIVQELKPTALIGAATIPQVFTERIVKDMASWNERPIIFALSNPTSKAECTAEQAYTWTNGKVVYASGSPFNPVTLPSGETFIPGQGNNSYIFPGVALGTILGGIRHVTDEIFLIASETCAGLVTAEHLKAGRVYPPLEDCREISIKIATAVLQYAYKNGMASFYPEPEDKEQFIRSQIYNLDYDDIEPHTYNWPEEHMKIRHA